MVAVLLGYPLYLPCVYSFVYVTCTARVLDGRYLFVLWLKRVPVAGLLFCFSLYSCCVLVGCGSIQGMRAILLFLVLIIVLLVAYILVPVEQMQTRAKDTIDQAQSLHTSLDFDTVVDGFGGLFGEQEYVLGEGGGATGQEDVADVSDVLVPGISPQDADEVAPEEEGSAVLVR